MVSNHRAKKTIFLGPAECGTDMLDGFKANYNPLDLLKLLTKAFNLIGMNTSQTTSIDPTVGEEYANMQREINKELSVQNLATDSELSKLLEDGGFTVVDDDGNVSGGLIVVDDDGNTNTVSTLAEAIKLIEDGNVLTEYKYDKVVSEPVSNVVPVLSDTPKTIDCCETCGEVTCVCDN